MSNIRKTTTYYDTLQDDNVNFNYEALQVTVEVDKDTEHFIVDVTDKKSKQNFKMKGDDFLELARLVEFKKP